MHLKYKSYHITKQTKKCIVAIHGWGGNASSFYQIINSLKLDDVGFYCPQAPYKIDKNKFSWSYQHPNGKWEVDEAKNLFNLFFDQVILSMHDHDDVYVIGFSQGASVCYELITQLKQPIGGIFPIAGFLRSSNPTYFDKISKNILIMPVIIAHGIKDDVVSPEKSQEAYTLLKRAGMKKIKINFYEGAHKINVKFLQEVRKKIKGK